MEYELYHSGVKGMKWGIRRYQNPDGSLTPAGKKRYGTKANFEKVQRAKKIAEKSDSKAKARAKADARTEAEVNRILQKTAKKNVAAEEAKKDDAKVPKTKSIKEMSSEELQAKIDRANLESRYRQVMKESTSSPNTKSRAEKGKEFALSLLEGAAKNIGQQAVTYLVGTAVNKTLGEMLGDPKMVNPKKGQKDK